MSDAQVFRIISEGIAGTGMPAFHSLSEAERRSVIQHLRALQGRGQVSTMPGNPATGKTLFVGKGECSSCHMVASQGGFMGSDLTAYARGKSVQQVRQAITDPASNPNPRAMRVVATTRDGRKLAGIIRNEDNFSVQLQTTDGGFQFLQKSELVSLEAESHPLMPSDYGERLSQRELDDLVSYLMSVAATRKASPTIREED